MTPANCSRDLGTLEQCYRIGQNNPGQAMEQIRVQQLRFCLCSAYDLSCSSLPMCCNIGTTKIDLWNLWILYGCIWGTWTGDKPQDRDDTSSPRGCWKMHLHICVSICTYPRLSLSDDITGVLKGITLRAKRKQLRKMYLPIDETEMETDAAPCESPYQIWKSAFSVYCKWSESGVQCYLVGCIYLRFKI